MWRIKTKYHHMRQPQSNKWALQQMRKVHVPIHLMQWS